MPRTNEHSRVTLGSCTLESLNIPQDLMILWVPRQPPEGGGEGLWHRADRTPCEGGNGRLRGVREAAEAKSAGLL